MQIKVQWRGKEKAELLNEQFARIFTASKEDKLLAILGHKKVTVMG